MSFRSLLNSTGDLLRPATTTDAAGYPVNTLAAVAENQPCTTQPISGGLQMEYARAGINVSHVHYLTTNLNPIAGDIFRTNGIDYRVHRGEDQAGRNRVFAIHSLRKD